MDYYANNTKAFVESTLQVDMQPLYQRFLPLLPKRAHILDAGCGSGRDAKFFIERGYQVTAFDASAEIAALAEKEIGQPVQVQRLQDVQYRKQFDGIWACASLLHVPAKELPNVFHRLAHALKLNGVFYCSFKYGQGEYEKQGRRMLVVTGASGSGKSLLVRAGLWASLEEPNHDRIPGSSDWVIIAKRAEDAMARAGVETKAVLPRVFSRLLTVQLDGARHALSECGSCARVGPWLFVSPVPTRSLWRTISPGRVSVRQRYTASRNCRAMRH